MGQREAAVARTAAAARDFQGSGSGRGSDVMKNGGSGSGRGSDIMKKGGSGSGRGSDVIIAAQVLTSTFCSPILSLFSLLLSIPVRFSFRSQSVKRVTLIFDFLSTLVFDNLSLFIYLRSIIIIIHFMHLVLHGVSEPCPYLEFFSNMTNFSNKSSR